MDSTAEPSAQAAYVFGYGSLVAMRDPVRVGGVLLEPAPGRLRGFRRAWGVAMDNRAAAPASKHYVEVASGETPSVRVAFLDLEECDGEAVRGLAVPADAERLAALDVREANYTRVDVSAWFEPQLALPVFTYRGTPAARARCRVPPTDPELCVSAGYLEEVRRAFRLLGPAALAEFERTTPPPPFPLRALELVRPDPSAEGMRPGG